MAQNFDVDSRRQNLKYQMLLEGVWGFKTSKEKKKSFTFASVDLNINQEPKVTKKITYFTVNLKQYDLV